MSGKNLRGQKKSERNRLDSKAVLVLLAAVLYFLAVCLTSATTGKMAGMALSVLSLALVFLFFSRLRDRIGVPLLLLAAVVLMDGISTFYAVSGKFALYEFLKVLSAFCLTLLLLAAAPEGEPGRWIASVLEGFGALAGVVSIDLLSTRWLSGSVVWVLGQFTPDYAALDGVEAGVRMTSLFVNPNVFAGVAGLGVLLSLGLARSSGTVGERRVHLVCLYVNALSFLLAFSMGASGAIALAFLVYLVLEQRQARRVRLLVLMVETLVLTAISAAAVSVTSFQAWEGVQPVPLLCTVLGAAALCAVDDTLGVRLAARLDGSAKGTVLLTGGLLAALAAFVLLAFNWTGPETLSAGGALRRAAYPEPGTYSLEVQGDGAVFVNIESQNQQQTMMHTSTVLYDGPAEGAAFTVPDGSLVVYFNFSAPDGAHLETVAYSGQAGSGEVPLGYKLLPGFMANRLQGLFANENAIQRLVFFSDGMKIFRRSPAVGLGLGAFENGVKSVQSFYYETKYAHNHYIQTLAETGLAGLALFLALFGGSAAAVLLERRRGREAHPLTPALGASLVFMAAHAATEVVFSAYAYLPIAFGVFGLISLCCGRSLAGARLTRKLKTVSLLAVSALIGVYALLLGCNMQAQKLVAEENSLNSLAEAAALDRFEWADYALSYVVSVSEMEKAGGSELTGDIRAQADAFALRLSSQDSNTIPIYLAEYYFQNGRTADGLAMVEKYVTYVSSDPEGWRQAFELLERYEEDTDVYRAGVLRVTELLERWNQENMGEIVLEEQAYELIERIRNNRG